MTLVALQTWLWMLVFGAPPEDASLPAPPSATEQAAPTPPPWSGKPRAGKDDDDHDIYVGF